jgi:hypothetical protein
MCRYGWSIVIALILCPALVFGADEGFRPSLSYTPSYQFESDLDDEGSFTVERHFLRLDVSRPFNPQIRLGMGLHFDFEHWEVSDRSQLAGATPWGDIYRPSLNFSAMYSPNPNWRFMVAPSIGFYATNLSNASDSLMYGATVSAMRSWGRSFSLGLGLGAFERLDEFDVFPYLAIRWQITERLRLQNPFQAGPVGPAGLELQWQAHERWDLGVGGAWRSYRFRLDSDNLVPDGVGEVEFFAGFVRLSHHMTDALSFDLTAGALFDGEISVENESGQHVDEVGHETSPFLALSLKGRF